MGELRNSRKESSGVPIRTIDSSLRSSSILGQGELGVVCVMQSRVMAHFDGLGEARRNDKSDLDQCLARQTSTRGSLHVLGVAVANQRVKGVLDTIHHEVRALGTGGSDLLDSTSCDLDGSLTIKTLIIIELLRITVHYSQSGNFQCQDRPTAQPRWLQRTGFPWYQQIA